MFLASKPSILFLQQKNQNNVQISNIIFIAEKFQSQNKVESVMNTIQEKRKEKKQKVHKTKKKNFTVI